CVQPCCLLSLFSSSTDTATTALYTLSLHDALPISFRENNLPVSVGIEAEMLYVSVGITAKWLIDAMTPMPKMLDQTAIACVLTPDRKSTRLNSSHVSISYAVFCLKKNRGDAPPPRV